MKYLLAPVLLLSIVGCSAKSPYDITPEQAQHRVVKTMGGGGPIDLKHLPAGAVKHEMTIKKGERLPNGEIADQDAKIVTVEMNGKGPGGPGGAPRLELGGGGSIKDLRIQTQ